MAPIIKIQDGRLSVLAFDKVSKEGKGYRSFVIQRSYKVNDEWKNETINIFADDLLKISSLCDEAYKQNLLKKPEKVVIEETEITDLDSIPFNYVVC